MPDYTKLVQALLGTPNEEPSPAVMNMMGLAGAFIPTKQEAIDALLYNTPVVGNALSARDSYNAFADRDWLGAGLGALGAAPFLGGMAKPFNVDYFGKAVKVLHNPSPQETFGFLNKTKYKAGRRIVDPETGDTFIWDAADPALHRMMGEKLGVPMNEKTIADVIGLD